MKTSTFDRALLQDANMTPLRGESLGRTANRHCHCYHDLKGTLKRNPHCTAHRGVGFHHGSLKGTGTYRAGLGLGVISLATYVGYTIYSKNNTFSDLETSKMAAVGLAGYALGGMTGWGALP